MSTAELAAISPGRRRSGLATSIGPRAAGGVLFLALFAAPAAGLARDWMQDPDAGHGLLLAPVALYLAWRRGLDPERAPAPRAGLLLLCLAVGLHAVASLAAELFSGRFALWLALCALVVFAWGFGQLRHWSLPALLLLLCIPLPSIVMTSLSFPLQLQSSRIGAALLEWRRVPVLLSGNVIQLPGHSLFVTEACSGLRSLTSLLALGILIAAGWLSSPLRRVLLVASAIPLAMVINGVRVFLTGFLVFFVDPKLGDGFLHLTEGWLLFVVAFLLLFGLASLLARIPSRGARPSPTGAAG